MADRITIHLPCDLRFRNAVGALLQQICELLEQDGEAPETGHLVRSAFNEAFNNLTQYSYPAMPGGPVEVELELDSRSLVLQVRDRGESFDFDKVGLPDIESLPESGLGLFIIRSAMSEVEYLPGREGSMNVLRMVKHLRGPGWRSLRTEENRGIRQDA